MNRDQERIRRLQQGLEDESLDALVCTLPHNVLLLSGYWPVVGLSAAVVTREGRVAVLAPEDEKELADCGWADEVHTFAGASLNDLRGSIEIVREALTKAASGLSLAHGSVLGYENDGFTIPAPYAAFHLFGASVRGLIETSIPNSKLRPGSDLLQRQRAILTPGELDHLRTSCRIGQQAFLAGAARIHAGMLEAEVANAFRLPLSADGIQANQIARADGWAWCMSGPNSAQAAAAYARTRNRQTVAGDLVMVHCNSYADGFWTDITRTFCFGSADPRQCSMYEAVFAASNIALETIKPGVKAAAVDHAAREMLRAHGFDKEFKHATGHGVGFSAISHNARPRLHPLSPDVLESGMVFNVEPAIYIEGYGGVRHCNMVAVTKSGTELLTPFQANLETLRVL